MGTYRNRRLKASVREHITDAVLFGTAGAVGAVVLWLITLAIASHLGIAL